MADLVRFVDSIDASPTLRLDLNDESAFWVKRFSAPPPRLRRSMSENAMRDGVSVGSSAYGARTLVMELECRKPTQDAAATEIQKLWRELDRAGNFIQYQPQGASKPVFFKTFRSDASQLEDVIGQAAMRNFTVEVLAEPFALGLKEKLGPYTIANDPAAATNPCYVDLPDILGDVAAPVVYWDEASGGDGYRGRIIAAHADFGGGTPAVASGLQAEALYASTDTANPGGGPDAAMSGTGTNNYLRTSFSTTPGRDLRVYSDLVAQPGGSYRILVAVRRSAATSTITVDAKVSHGVSEWQSEARTLLATTSRQFVDLGVAPWPTAEAVGLSGQESTSSATLTLYAERDGGTDTLDWDCVHLLPAGGQTNGAGAMIIVRPNIYADRSVSSSGKVILDGEREGAYFSFVSTDPTTTAVRLLAAAAAGGFPTVAPGADNRIYVLSWSVEDVVGSYIDEAAVSTSTAVSLAYWPRYLFVRPVSS